MSDGQLHAIVGDDDHLQLCVIDGTTRFDVPSNLISPVTPGQIG